MMAYYNQQLPAYFLCDGKLFKITQEHDGYVGNK